jgi:hypothetical protein
MKNETLLQTLKDINVLNDKAKMHSGLEKLIEAVKREITLEENKGLSNKQRLNYCLNLAKRLATGNTKKVLGYTCNDQIKGKQVFCDSFFLVALAEADRLPIADYTEAPEKLNYPIVERIIIPSNYGSKTFTCNVGKLLQHLKAHKQLHLVNETTGFNTVLHEENVKNFVTFMNYSTKDNITFQCRTIDKTELAPSTSPVYAKNKNGSYGIVLPLARFREDEKQPVTITEAELN